MRTYRAYDHRIRSQVFLPELVGSDGDPDVRIRTGEVPPSPATLPRAYETVYESPDGSQVVSAAPGSVHWSYEGAVALLVEDGTDVVVDVRGTVPDERVRQVLLGPGLRSALIQRGYLVLHASAAAIDGRAVAFLGDSGAGKSTLAAACYAEGHCAVCDDVTAVRTDADGPAVLPGFPCVKLHRDPAERSALSPRTADAPPAALERRYYDVSDRFVAGPRPLARVYVVERGADPGVEPLERRSFPTTVLDPLYRLYAESEREALGVHFRKCAEAARHTDLKRLTVPGSLGELPEAVRSIERDLGCDP